MRADDPPPIDLGMLGGDKLSGGPESFCANLYRH
jgi:hypothetical protein